MDQFDDGRSEGQGDVIAAALAPNMDALHGGAECGPTMSGGRIEVPLEHLLMTVGAGAGWLERYSVTLVLDHHKKTWSRPAVYCRSDCGYSNWMLS